jgi:hypothetical protein
MPRLFRSIQQWLAAIRPFRRLGDALYRMKMRRRAAELDRLAVSRCQKRALLGLVHKARNTRFGLAHDFRRIKSIADFQRLVPLQDPTTLWRDYWQTAQADLAGATWPGPASVLNVAAWPPTHGSQYLPVTPGLLAAHRAALRTALALAFTCRPDSLALPQLVAGQLCRVGSGPLSGSTGWLVGASEHLAQLVGQRKEPGGQEQQMIDLWPKLAALSYATAPGRDHADNFQRLLDSGDALELDGYLPPEGPVAVEDPRNQQLRLIPDLGIYFELVPVAELGKLQPARHCVADLETGVPYALAVTSPAGLWACLTGARLCFEQRDPPLFRLLENVTVAHGPLAAREDVPLSPPHGFPPRAPHGRRAPAGRETKPESWKKAARRLLSDV